MLRIYSVALVMVRDAMHVRSVVQRHDPDLANQLSRAATSVPLHVAEGSLARGRNRNAHYDAAATSANEVRAVYRVAECAGWLSHDEVRHGRLSQIIGTLINVTKPSWRRAS